MVGNEGGREGGREGCDLPSHLFPLFASVLVPETIAMLDG